MSFSSKVKLEIQKDFGEDRHCRIAFLSAIINGTCEIAERSMGGALAIEQKTDSLAAANAFAELVQLDFAGLGHEKILQATGFIDSSKEVQLKLSSLVVKKVCCKRAYLKAAFVMSGSVNGPDKEYHLEFVAPTERFAGEIAELLRSFDLTPKIAARKSKYIVYFKESEQIAEVLNIFGAHISFLEFENNRAGKELGNSINRAANCEAANADKSISAAVKQIEDIGLIEKTIGINALPIQLQECARLRLLHPELNLTELGGEFSPPIGKSGVNHRFRKIAEIAKDVL